MGSCNKLSPCEEVWQPNGEDFFCDEQLVTGITQCGKTEEIEEAGNEIFVVVEKESEQAVYWRTTYVQRSSGYPRCVYHICRSASDLYEAEALARVLIGTIEGMR